MNPGVQFFLAFLWALLCGYLAVRKGRSFWGYFLLSFVITPLITMIIVFELRSLIVEESPTQTETLSDGSSGNSDSGPMFIGGNNQDRSLTPAVESAPHPKPPVQYCMHCGNKLKAGYRFCGYCGKKIEEIPDDL